MAIGSPYAFDWTRILHGPLSALSSFEKFSIKSNKNFQAKIMIERFYIWIYDIIRLNFIIYPGILNYSCAKFLRPYYEARRRSAGPARWLFNLVIYAGFQTWLPWRVRAVASRWNLDAAWEKRTLAICQHRFVDPNDIALFRIEDVSELDHYMRRFEHIGIGRAMALREADHNPNLLDKRRFYQLCATNGVMHPAVMLACRNGETAVHARPVSGQELFVKPAQGSGGRGAFTMRFDDDDDGSDRALARFMAQLAARGGPNWIAQLRLRAHPDLADITCEALPTARIVSILDEWSQPEAVSTVLRFAATADAIVDNIGLGGLSAPIDLVTGALGEACGGMAPGEYADHPLTGARIGGRIVPFWTEALALARDAHMRCFADHVMIGWDVGLTADGPILLEGNARPSIILAQRATRMPVGKTRMGALIAYHLAQRQQEGSARSRRLITAG